MKVLGCNEHPHNGKVYVISNGLRRWANSREILDSYNIRFPEDVEWVDSQTLSSYDFGPMVPKPRTKSDLSEASPFLMREYISTMLKGNGVEFGAISNPFPVSLDCNVQYADIFDHTIEETHYDLTGIEIVNIKFKTNFDEMNGIDDESLDFIITSHVIEHLKNPIMAIQKSWEKLKPDGKLVLIVPHRDLTFDKKRDLTTLEHIIKDYKDPSLSRDLINIMDFYSLVFSYSQTELISAIENSFINKIDIHYHVWNEQSFLELLDYFCAHIYAWKNIWHHNALQHVDANEFYVVLTK